MTVATVHSLPVPPQPCAEPADSLFPGFLSLLGFAGLEALEVPIVCALATGEPLLMVGRHGCAKSAVTRAVAEALGLRFHAYDASKALFEDVIGFPDPSSLAQGRVRYVPTPLSLWDKEFVLVDELSRASPALQNKWLEIVRDRAVMGLRAERLRHVFAAMNPADYAGATALDEALAGRFAWVVPVPDVATFEPEAIERVIRTVSPADAPLAAGFRLPAPEGPGEDLSTLVDRVRAAIPEAVRLHDDGVVAWVRELGQAFEGSEGRLDGRRMGMLRRNALAALALDGISGTATDPYDLLLGVLRQSLPHPATGAEVPEATVLVAHACAHDRAFGQRKSRSVADEILAIRDPLRLLYRYLARAPSLSEPEHDRVLERLLGPVTTLEGEQRVEAAFVALELVREVFAAPGRFPHEVAARVLAWGGRVLGVHSADITETVRAASATPELRSCGPLESLVLRLSVELAKDKPGAEERIDPDDLARWTALIRPRARAALSAAIRRTQGCAP